MNIFVLGNKYDEILSVYGYKSGKMSKIKYEKLMESINKYNINSNNSKLTSIFEGVRL